MLGVLTDDFVDVGAEFLVGCVNFNTTSRIFRTREKKIGKEGIELLNDVLMKLTELDLGKEDDDFIVGAIKKSNEFKGEWDVIVNEEAEVLKKVNEPIRRIYEKGGESLDFIVESLKKCETNEFISLDDMLEYSEAAQNRHQRKNKLGRKSIDFLAEVMNHLNDVDLGDKEYEALEKLNELKLEGDEIREKRVEAMKKIGLLFVEEKNIEAKIAALKFLDYP